MSQKAQSSRPQRKAAAYVAPVLACASLVVAGVSLTMMTHGSSISAVPATSPLPDDSQPSLATVLASLGLTPEAFAAAGVDSGEVATAVESVGTYLAEHGPELGAAQVALQQAKASAERLERLIQSGSASEGDVQSLQTCKSTIQAAASTQQHLLSGAFAAACDGMPQAKAELLGNIRENATSGLPMKYRTVLRSPESALALRDALGAVRAANRLGKEADPNCVSAVATADALAATVAAQASLGERLAGTVAAWKAAVAP